MQVGRYEHLFDYNPLFGVPNNKEMIGDAEKVIHLIDAYDLTMSDASSEISQFSIPCVTRYGYE